MNSILDQDYYKCTMQQAAMVLYPRATAKYRFINRGRHQITEAMLSNIREDVAEFSRRRLTAEEGAWLRSKCPVFFPWYVDWLMGFHADASQVKVTPAGPSRMSSRPSEPLIEIVGPWHEAIYWEAPLLAIITKHIMADQKSLDNADLTEVATQAGKKMACLRQNYCHVADFGTRRRFSYDVQDRVIQQLITHGDDHFIGTSNMHFAHKYEITPIGTMAHEWIQAISGLVGLRHANRFALDAWSRVYEGRLGIALTDTFGTDAFFRDFDGVRARLYDGVRQDSGDPIAFMKKVVAHYECLGIDPMSKRIVYSDSLDVGKAALYQRASEKRIGCSFGIGTHLTNDVPGTTPTNVVIKMVEIDGVPVVKLSDDPDKATGDPEALDVARWTFGV